MRPTLGRGGVAGDGRRVSGVCGGSELVGQGVCPRGQDRQGPQTQRSPETALLLEVRWTSAGPGCPASGGRGRWMGRTQAGKKILA